LIARKAAKRNTSFDKTSVPTMHLPAYIKLKKRTTPTSCHWSYRL